MTDFYENVLEGVKKTDDSVRKTVPESMLNDFNALGKFPNPLCFLSLLRSITVSIHHPPIHTYSNTPHHTLETHTLIRL